MSAEIKLVIDSYTQDESLQQTNESLKEMLNYLQQISKFGLNIKNTNNVSEILANVQAQKSLNEELTKSKIVQDQLTQAKKSAKDVSIEALRLQAQQETQEKKNTKSAKESADVFKKAEKDKADALKKSAKEQADANKPSIESIRISKLRDIITQSEIGSLNQKKAQLSLVTMQVNKMSEADLKGTQAGQELVATQKRLTYQLNATEQAGGNFHRQVGNYGLAVTNLSRGLGGLTGLLSGVGRLFGFDTTQLEELHAISREFIKTSRELAYTRTGEAEVERDIGIAQTENIATTEAQVVASGEAVVATEAQTIAQEELNATILANPYALAIAGIVALAGVIVAWVAWTDKAKKAEEERSKAVDGSIIIDKQSREEHNAAIYTLQKLNVQYELLTGSINEYQAAVKNINIESNQALTKLNEDTNDKLKETEGFWSNLGSAIKNNLEFEFTAGAKGSLDPMKEQNDEKAKIMEDANRKLLDIQKEHDAKMIYELEQISLKELADFNDLEVARLKNVQASEELVGTNIISIQRKILAAQFEIDKNKVKNEADAHEQIYILTQKYNTSLLELDKQWAEQRRTAYNDLVKLEISNMQTGYDRDLAAIKENYREQREAILFDVTKTSAEKTSAEIKYGIEESEKINDLDEKLYESRLKARQDANKKLLKSDLDYYEEKAKQDEAKIDDEMATDKSMNELANAQLKESLINKKITKYQYDLDVLKNKKALDEEDSKNTLQKDDDDIAQLKKKAEAITSTAADVDAYLKAVNKRQQDALDGAVKEANDQADIDQLEFDRKKKLRDEELKQTDQFVKQLSDIQTKKSEDRVTQLGIESNAEDEAITQQQIRAAQGLSNDLAFEEEKKAKLDRAAIEEQKRQEKIKKREAFWNLFAEYAKTDGDKTALKTAEQLAVGEALVLAFAEKGGMGEDLNDTSILLNGNFSKSHSNGDIPTLISPKEGILTEQNIAALGGSDGFYNLKSMLENPVSDDLFARQNDSFTKSFVAMPQINIKPLIDEMREVKEAVKNIPQVENRFNELGEWIQKVKIKNSSITTNKGVFIRPSRKKIID